MISLVWANARSSAGIAAQAALAEVERDPDAGDGAPVVLTLPADVVEAHPKGRRGGQPGEDERRAGHERRRERAVAEERGVEEPAVRRAGGVPGDEQDDRHEREANRDRPDGHGERQPAGLIQPPFESHRARPPAISRPMSSTDDEAGSSSPTRAPSYMTTMRSASARTSSRSSLNRSTATPAAAASRRYAWTVSIAPTSSPRVGWPATSTRGSPSNSRPRTSFWRLPPERFRTGTSGPGAFTS